MGLGRSLPSAGCVTCAGRQRSSSHVEHGAQRARSREARAPCRARRAAKADAGETCRVVPSGRCSSRCIESEIRGASTGQSDRQAPTRATTYPSHPRAAAGEHGSFYSWVQDQLERLGSFSEAVTIFEKNYDEMVEVNTMYADKYYHCMANCEAAAIGRGHVAETISDAREWVDQHIKWDSEGASACDQQANRDGRNTGADDWYECTVECSGWRPFGLDRQGIR